MRIMTRDEVDHTYVLGWDQEIKKVKLPHPKNKKASVSEIELDSTIFTQYVHEMFSYLPDSVHGAALVKDYWS